MSSNNENPNRRYPEPLKAVLRFATNNSSAPRERPVDASAVTDSQESVPSAQTSTEEQQQAREEWDRIQQWPGNSSERPRQYPEAARSIVKWATQ